MSYEVQTRRRAPEGQGRPISMPGGRLALLIAALTALLVGYWMRPAQNTPRADNGVSVSSVADVLPEDLPAALETMAGTPRQMAQFRERDACGQRLAWVTIMRAPGQAPGRIRLQSGSYYSPPFELLETPARVALPYPAPYETGHGVILVVGATTPALVALTPPWHVPAQAGVEAKQVTWKPINVCPSARK